MKKVFNASILAAAVALSFGTTAADLTIANPTTVSVEAAAAGKAAGPKHQVIRTITRQELIPGDKVTFTFPKGTTFTPLVDTTAKSGFSNLTIDYGNGTFTFTKIKWNAATATAAATLEMEVQLGNPVINNSAYDIIFSEKTQGAPAAGDFVPGAGNVTYVAVDGVTGVVKDTGGNNSAALTATKNQEVASVIKAFDGFVNRDNRNLLNNKGNKVAEVSIAQPSNGIAADITAGVVSGKDLLVLQAAKGLNDLGSVVVSNCSDTTVANGVACTAPALASTSVVTVLAAAFTCSTDTTNPKCVKDTASFNIAPLVAALPAATGTATGKAGTLYIGVVAGTGTSPKAQLPLTDFSVTRSVTYTQLGTTGADPVYKYIDAAYAGKFQLDATVVNVPYLPVGLALTPNVEIANAGVTDAEIQIQAFDQNGIAYGPVTLAKKATKGAVTKVSEADIEAAFALGKASGKKLSVTFVIDANADDITLAPYYRDGASRVNVISDQYKK